MTNPNPISRIGIFGSSSRRSPSAYPQAARRDLRPADGTENHDRLWRNALAPLP